MTAELKKLLPELNENQHKLLDQYIAGIIDTSKEIIIVRGKEAEIERYCDIREELRTEQKLAAGIKS